MTIHAATAATATINTTTKMRVFVGIVFIRSFPFGA